MLPCATPIPAPPDCANSDNRYTLKAGQAACRIASIAPGERVGLDRSLGPVPVCLDEEESGPRTLVGSRPDNDAPSAAIVTISPADSTAAARQLSFSSRRPTEMWVWLPGTDLNPASRSQTIELDNVGSNLDRAVAFASSPDVGPMKVTRIRVIGGNSVANDPKAAIADGQLRLQVDRTQGIGALAVDLQNSLGEEATLRITLDPQYFTEDRSLFEKLTALASLYKVAADEAYLTSTGQCLTNDPGTPCRPYDNAAGLYRKALDSIPSCRDRVVDPAADNRDPCTDTTFVTTWDLLRADIRYRQKLIEWDLPFFGGIHSLTPTTPHHELIKMEAALVDMTELMRRIDAKRQRYVDFQVNQEAISAEKAYALGVQDAEEFTIQETARARDYATLDVDTFIDRQAELEREIGQLQQSLNALGARQDSLAKQAAALTQAGIAAASGVPIGNIKALASGDLEGVARAFVEQQILSSDGLVSKEILAQSELARGIVEKVGEVRKVADKLKSFEHQARIIQQAVKGDRQAIERLIQEYGSEDARQLIAQATELQGTMNEAIAMSRSLDRKRAIAFLQGQLSAPQLAEINRIVAEIKPIEHVFEAAYTQLMEGNFQDPHLIEFDAQLRTVLDRANPSGEEVRRMRQELKQLVNVDQGVLSDPYFKRQTLAAIDTFERGSRDIVRSVLTLDPELILKQPAIGKIIDRLPPADRLRVTTSLREMSNYPSDYVREEEDSICLRYRSDRACVKFGALRDEFRRQYDKAAAFPRDRMQRFLDQHIDRLPKHGVLLLHLARNGPGGFSGSLRTLFDGSPDRLKRAWDGISFSGALFRNKEVKDAGRVAVAELLTASQMPVPPAPPAMPAPAEPANDGSSIGDPTEGGLDPTTNAIIQGALNYAMPGAGVALQLGQAWAEMDATRELQIDVMKRLSSAILEQDQLARSKQLATRTAALAGLQHDRAVAVQRAGQQQMAHFRIALTATMNEKDFLRELMNLYRPRFYYLAETLRERFDAFDRSLADWTDGDPAGGFFRTKILQDPNNARLALDSEIQLFGWLNRNIEATRTSPYALHHHWERLIGLARDYCSKAGCKPGDGQLGQIGTTTPQLFFDEIQGKLAKRTFDKWRSDPARSATFRQTFSIVPGQLGVPTDVVNARLLDVAIVPLDARGQALAGSSVRLKHKGHSALLLADPTKPGSVKIKRHMLVPRDFLPANRERVEDAEVLRNRFQNQVSVATLLPLRDFEGYGLYGNFELEVLNGPLTPQIDDLKIMISYIFKSPRNILSEADFVAKREAEVCKTAVASGSSAPLTGVFCHTDGVVRYERAIVTSTGAVECDGSAIAEFKLSEPEHAELLRRLGHLSCLKVTPSSPPLVPTVGLILDPALIEEKRKKCSQNEVGMMAVAGKDTGRCFGERP